MINLSDKKNSSKIEIEDSENEKKIPEKKNG